MFNKLKRANPENITVTIEDGELCFYMYLAFPHGTADGKKEFSEKQLNLVAREKLDIERFEQEQPQKKGMWQVVEDNGIGRAYKLKFFPFKGTERKYHSLSSILELMYRG